MAIPASSAPSNFKTDQVWRNDRDHFSHPWTHFESFKAEGWLVIAEGKGAYVNDSTGKRYRETREPLPDEVNVGKRISNHCEARGLIVLPIGPLNVMSPPLI